MSRSLVICFAVFCLISCKKYGKEFYGTYENLDTNWNSFSTITFYENNRYAFYRSTGFAQTSDSGSFTLVEDIISFHSLDLPLPGSTDSSVKSLNNINFRYQAGKVLYIRQLNPVVRPPYFDTILVGLKKI